MPTLQACSGRLIRQGERPSLAARCDERGEQAESHPAHKAIRFFKRPIIAPMSAVPWLLESASQRFPGAGDGGSNLLGRGASPMISGRDGACERERIEDVGLNTLMELA